MTNFLYKTQEYFLVLLETTASIINFRENIYSKNTAKCRLSMKSRNLTPTFKSLCPKPVVSGSKFAKKAHLTYAKSMSVSTFKQFKKKKKHLPS